MRRGLVDRVSGVPLYGQIADDLESRLREVYAPGDLLPPVAALADEYEVNRLTVREALGVLARRGLVRTVKGKGTFAALPTIRFTVQPGEDASLTAAMAGAGRTVENQVRSVTTDPDEVVRAQLGAAGPVHRFESVRYVDGAPWSITVTWVDPARFPGLDEAWQGGSLHALLLERYGVRMSRSARSFAALTAEPDEAAVLQVPVASPVLRVRGGNVDQDGVVVAVVEHRFRGDRVEFAVDPS
ncbi:MULTISPECIES: GntR family transcriptional regulator [unclassified Modestobacter]